MKCSPRREHALKSQKGQRKVLSREGAAATLSAEAESQVAGCSGWGGYVKIKLKIKHLQ